MSKDTYDVLVFIGRFSPFHNGHKAVLDQALEQADRVVVLVGSSYAPRNIRDPWTFDERCDMIFGAVGNSGRGDLTVAPLPDYPYNDNKWKAAVRTAVMHAQPWSDYPPKVGLIGHSKDHTSYYLKMFPDWGSVEVENYEGINATDIRENMFSNGVWKYTDAVTTPIADLVAMLPTSIFTEYNLIAQYKKAWEAAPYPVTFQTVDAVVIQSGHVLLVKRKSAPGMGLWALPGGFLDHTETLLDGAIRELKEETKLKVPERTLKRLAEGTGVTFDAPYRSTRGRTITQAFFIDLGDDKQLPKVVGSDDAEKAVWVPFNEVKREMMFEDHFHIIDHFTNIG